MISHPISHPILPAAPRGEQGNRSALNFTNEKTSSAGDFFKVPLSILGAAGWWWWWGLEFEIKSQCFCDFMPCCLGRGAGL